MGGVNCSGQFPGALHTTGSSFHAAQPHGLVLQRNGQLLTGQAWHVELNGENIGFLVNRLVRLRGGSGL